MINEKIKSELKEIRSFYRLKMNGPGSQSMREKGLDYKLNWGVPLVDLKLMAKQYGKDYDLAIELWKDDIRESKILATLVMPAEKMLPEITEIWMDSIHNQELVEMLAFNLLQYVSYAPVIAYQWMSCDKPLYQIAAYDILSRLFMQGREPNERGINEFLDQVAVSLQEDHIGVRHAAANSVWRFADMGVVYSRMAKNALKGILEVV